MRAPSIDIDEGLRTVIGALARIVLSYVALTGLGVLLIAIVSS
jgi:hypothetical protein